MADDITQLRSIYASLVDPEGYGRSYLDELSTVEPTGTNPPQFNYNTPPPHESGPPGKVYAEGGVVDDLGAGRFTRSPMERREARERRIDQWAPPEPAPSPEWDRFRDVHRFNPLSYGMEALSRLDNRAGAAAQGENGWTARDYFDTVNPIQQTAKPGDYVGQGLDAAGSATNFIPGLRGLKAAMYPAMPMMYDLLREGTSAAMRGDFTPSGPSGRDEYNYAVPEFAGGGRVAKAIKEITNKFGSYQGSRMQRAADETNLERIHPEGLREMFDPNKSGLFASMPPGDFQDYAARIPQSASEMTPYPRAHNVPGSGRMRPEDMTQDWYLDGLAQLMEKKGAYASPELHVGKDLGDLTNVIEHEGRHRAMAMDRLGDPRMLTQIKPTGRGAGWSEMDPEGRVDWLTQKYFPRGAGTLVVPEPIGGRGSTLGGQPNIIPRLPRPIYSEPYAEGGRVVSKLAQTLKRELFPDSNPRRDLYVRFGDWPADERSRNHALSNMYGPGSRDIYEPGVSVYPTKGPALTPDLSGMNGADFNFRFNREGVGAQQQPAYIVQGRRVGAGYDGEPLLRDVEAMGSYGIPKGLAPPVPFSDNYAGGGKVLSLIERLAGGKPKEVKLPGGDVMPAHPIREFEDVADKFAGRYGNAPIENYPKMDEDRARKIAEGYELMQHNPSDPRVRRAYDALIDETMQQYRALEGTGAKFEFLKPGEGDPYAKSPSLGYKDLVDNGRLKVFPTEQGFGTQTDISDNPLLRRVGRVGDLDNATANDAFRLVHDALGHFGPGNPFFRAPGEERAWLNHMRSYSPDAVPAATSETRGQNSWVNFGPRARENKGASGADTIYADQKAGLLPEWMYEPNGKPPGYAGGGVIKRITNAIRAYHGSPHDFDKFDPSKIGSGQGANTFGTGHYFAESPDVARSYRDHLSGPGGGKMYDVDIHADPTSFFDWDKTLADQPGTWDRLHPHVRSAVDEAVDNKGWNPFSHALDDYTGRDLFLALNHHDVHDVLPPELPGSSWMGDTTPKKHTSAYLNSLDFPGLRYLDQFSRPDGDGTRNYVVFPGNEDLIDIKRKYRDGGSVVKLAKKFLIDPVRESFPGIYKDPDVLVREAKERLVPDQGKEGPMYRLFGHTRESLDDLAQGNQATVDTIRPFLHPHPFNLSGTAATSPRALTGRNARRLVDMTGEALEDPQMKLTRSWYEMSPLWDRASEVGVGDRGMRDLNTRMSVMSAGSDPRTEINRGFHANWLANEGRLDDFVKYGGWKEEDRGRDFPNDLRGLMGHSYHGSAQVPNLLNYEASGRLWTDKHKVPTYTAATDPRFPYSDRPVADSHFNRILGYPDVATANTAAVRNGVPSETEYSDIVPWFNKNVADTTGLRPRDAQALLWNLGGPQTGVRNIGPPKLEMIADYMDEVAKLRQIHPEQARDQLLRGEIGGAWEHGAQAPFAEGGQVDDFDNQYQSQFYAKGGNVLPLEDRAGDDDALMYHSMFYQKGGQVPPEPFSLRVRAFLDE